METILQQPPIKLKENDEPKTIQLDDEEKNIIESQYKKKLKKGCRSLPPEEQSDLIANHETALINKYLTTKGIVIRNLKSKITFLREFSSSYNFMKIDDKSYNA